MYDKDYRVSLNNSGVLASFMLCLDSMVGGLACVNVMLIMGSVDSSNGSTEIRC